MRLLVGAGIVGVILFLAYMLSEESGAPASPTPGSGQGVSGGALSSSSGHYPGNYQAKGPEDVPRPRTTTSSSDSTAGLLASIENALGAPDASSSGNTSAPHAPSTVAPGQSTPAVLVTSGPGGKSVTVDTDTAYYGPGGKAAFDARAAAQAQANSIWGGARQAQASATSLARSLAVSPADAEKAKAYNDAIQKQFLADRGAGPPPARQSNNYGHLWSN